MEIAPSPEGERRLLFLFHHLESFIFLPLPLLRGEFSHSSSSSSTPLFFFFAVLAAPIATASSFIYLFFVLSSADAVLDYYCEPGAPSSSHRQFILFTARDDALQNSIRPFVVTNGPLGTKSSYGWGKRDIRLKLRTNCLLSLAVQTFPAAPQNLQKKIVSLHN